MNHTSGLPIQKSQNGNVEPKKHLQKNIYSVTSIE